jgi:hypothetical protein
VTSRLLIHAPARSRTAKHALLAGAHLISILERQCL